MAPPLWKIKDGEIDLSTPKVMGILNVTPDSFFDGGLHYDQNIAIDRAYEMVEEGAHILDVGGESTRPGSNAVGPREELDRVLPVIEAISGNIGVPLSIDTQKAEVAEALLKKGVSIINDVKGLRDEAMISAAAASGAGVVIMHMKGIPKTMQDKPYYEDVFEEISEFLMTRAQRAEKGGVARERIVLDPGIGFGKRLQDNLEIFRRVSNFCGLGYPLLIGASRKSFIKMICGEKATRLAGSLVTHFHCALGGASILRVHDVRETREALEVLEALQKGEN